MLLRAYYHLKPFLPWRVRLGMRRWLIHRKLEKVSDIWPIKEGTQTPPPGWPGWPEGKKFAVVLTHDVESQKGLDRIKTLLQIERQLGFKSSYNLIPEGDYTVPVELRLYIASQGFEVGVHDLYHNGKLFNSKDSFLAAAKKINGYLKEWNAVGFRAGFMLRNLDWIGELDILYDATTFDTDPFEPQPEGVNTIFPFWISRQSAERGEQRTANSKRETANREQESQSPTTDHQPQTTVNDSPFAIQDSPLTASNSPFPVRHSPPSDGYIELPYTLPQDSTLYLFGRQRDNSLWKSKLDWIAHHGGMVLVNVHPDYIRLNDSQATNEYPLEYYTGLLEHLRANYAGQYWHALPREVAGLCKKSWS